MEQRQGRTTGLTGKAANRGLASRRRLYRKRVVHASAAMSAPELALQVAQVGVRRATRGEKAGREVGLVAAREAGRGDDVPVAEVAEPDRVARRYVLGLFHGGPRLPPLDDGGQGRKTTARSFSRSVTLLAVGGVCPDSAAARRGSAPHLVPL